MPIEDLERRGIPLKTTAAVTPVGGGQRVQRSSFVEMESQQKLWRWVLVAVLIMLTAEVWLAGRLTRPRSTSQGEPT
jgi:hypothetical protein